MALSGVTDPSNWSNPGGIDLTEFENAMDIYVNIPNTTYDYTILRDPSPVQLISDGASSCPPVMLYASDGDSVPYAQADEMKTALSGIGTTVTEYVLSGSNHAFKNWHVINDHTGKCVSSEVITFLQSYP
ncbi:MAG TPA: hypothetical protein VGG02_14975 [Chthoniobacterales bacterium]